MILLDANVLLYSYITDCEQHEKTRSWLERILAEGSESIALTWQVIAAFLRIGTNPRLFETPFQIEDAVAKLEKLLSHPMVALVGPTDNHWKLFSRSLLEKQIQADLVMDSRLATLAIEHNASIATTDRDFALFPEIKTINPLLIS